VSERQRSFGRIIAIALIVLGVVSIAVAGLKAIDPAAPEVTASAFEPPQSRPLYCGTLIDSQPPIVPALTERSFDDPEDQVRMDEAVDAANSACQSARQVHTVVVMAGAVVGVLGLWVLLRVTRSPAKPQHEVTLGG
jgi:hypothetical protein